MTATQTEAVFLRVRVGDRVLCLLYLTYTTRKNIREAEKIAVENKPAFGLVGLVDSGRIRLHVRGNYSCLGKPKGIKNLIYPPYQTHLMIPCGL